MTKYAAIKKSGLDIEKAEIETAEEGVFVYLYKNVEDLIPIFDNWYTNIEQAEKECYVDYGINKEDWVFLT